MRGVYRGTRLYMKKYYVDGGILIETPFFKCLGGGAGFGYGAVPGCKIIPTTNKLPSGEEYLLIDDEHPQTMFAEYYARTFFTTGYCWASLFHNSYRGAYSEFCNRIKDAGELIKISCDIGDGSNVSYLLMRQAFLIVLTALDTFIADTVLTRIINDEEIFYSYAVHTRNYKNCVKDIEDGENGKAEQKVIKFVLSHSYLSKSTIKETYLLLFGFSVVVDDEM